MTEYHKQVNKEVDDLLRIGLEASESLSKAGKKELAIEILRTTSVVAHNYMIATGLQEALTEFWKEKKGLNA